MFQQAGFVASDISGRAHRAEFYSQHTRYHRELVETSPVLIRSAVLADSSLKGATVHILSSNGKLSATAIEQPGHAGGELPEVASADVALALPRGIDGAPHEVAPIVLTKQSRVVEHGLVQPRELDHTGALAVDWLMGRIAAASNDLLSGLGFTPDFVRKSRISRMGVETKITCFNPMPAGSRLRSVVNLTHVGRKNIVLRHGFFLSDGTPTVAVDQSLVTVDMTTRRATDLPDFLREAAGNF